jgi:hypothetical protein
MSSPKTIRSRSGRLIRDVGLPRQTASLAETLASKGLDAAFIADLWGRDERPTPVSLTASDVASLPAVLETMRELDGRVGPIVRPIEAPHWNDLLRACLGRICAVISKAQSRLPIYSPALIDLPVSASMLKMSAARRGVDVAPGVLFVTTGFLRSLMEVASERAVPIPDVLCAHMLRLAAAGRLELERTSSSPIDIDTEWVERARDLGLSTAAISAAFDLEPAPMEELHSREMPDKERLVDTPIRRLRASALRVLLTEDRLLEEPKKEAALPDVDLAALSKELASIRSLSQQVDFRMPESFANALARFGRAQVDREGESGAVEPRRQLAHRSFSPAAMELSCLAAWFDQRLAAGTVNDAEEEALAQALMDWAGRGAHPICGHLGELGSSDLLPSLKAMAASEPSHAEAVRSLPFYERLHERAGDRFSAQPEHFRAVVQQALTMSKAEREEDAIRLLKKEEEEKSRAPRLGVLECLRRVLPIARFASLFGAEWLARQAFELDRAIPPRLSPRESAEWALHLYEAAGRPAELALVTVQYAQSFAREWSPADESTRTLRDAHRHAARQVWSHRGAVVLQARSTIDWALVAEVALGRPVDEPALTKALRTAAFEHLSGRSVHLDGRSFAEWVSLRAPVEGRFGGARYPAVRWSTRDDFAELRRLIEARFFAAAAEGGADLRKEASLAHALLTYPLAEEDPNLIVERFRAALEDAFSQDPRGDVRACWARAIESVGALWDRAASPTAGQYPDWFSSIDPSVIFEQIERLGLDSQDRRALLRHVFVADHFASSSLEKGEGGKASHRRWVTELDSEKRSALLDTLIEAGALSSAAEAVRWLQAPNERRTWGSGREPQSGGGLPCRTASYLLKDRVLSEVSEISEQPPRIAENALLAYGTLIATSRPTEEGERDPIATPELKTLSAALSREAARRLERGELSAEAFKALFLALTAHDSSAATDRLLRTYLAHPPTPSARSHRFGSRSARSDGRAGPDQGPAGPDWTWIANHAGARVLDPRLRLELARERTFAGIDHLAADRASPLAGREAAVRVLDDLLREFYPMTREASFDRDRALEDLAWRIDLPKEDLEPLIERWKTGVGRGVQPIWDRLGPSQALALEQLGPESRRALIRYAIGAARDFSEAEAACRDDLLERIRDPGGVYSKIFGKSAEPRRCEEGYQIQADLLVNGIRDVIDGSPPNERVPLLELLLHRALETTPSSTWQRLVEDSLPQGEGESGKAEVLGWISSLPEYQRATAAAHLMLAEGATLKERLHRLIAISSDFIPAHAEGRAAHPMRAARKVWIQSELSRLASQEERRRIARLVRVVGAGHGRTAVLLRLHDDREVLAVVESRADSRKRGTDRPNLEDPRPPFRLLPFDSAAGGRVSLEDPRPPFRLLPFDSAAGGRVSLAGGEEVALVGASGFRQRPELGFYAWAADPADAQALVNAALRADHPDHAEPVRPMNAIAVRAGHDRSDPKGGGLR